MSLENYNYQIENSMAFQAMDCDSPSSELYGTYFEEEEKTMHNLIAWYGGQSWSFKVHTTKGLCDDSTHAPTL